MDTATIKVLLILDDNTDMKIPDGINEEEYFIVDFMTPAETPEEMYETIKEAAQDIKGMLENLQNLKDIAKIAAKVLHDKEPDNKNETDWLDFGVTLLLYDSQNGVDRKEYNNRLIELIKNDDSELAERIYVIRR